MRGLRVDDDLGQKCHGTAPRQPVLEFLLEDVADHPLALGAEDVEGVRRHLRVRLCLESEQADLRPVAVRQHDIVSRGQLGDRGHRLACVLPLDLGRQRLAAAEQRVPAEGDDKPRPLALRHRR